MRRKPPLYCGSIWWKPFQMTIIAATIAVTYHYGLRNPWGGGLIGFMLAWLVTRLISWRWRVC
jgi:hypothetical protein